MDKENLTELKKRIELFKKMRNGSSLINIFFAGDLLNRLNDAYMVFSASDTKEFADYIAGTSEDKLGTLLYTFLFCGFLGTYFYSQKELDNTKEEVMKRGEFSK